MFEVLTDLINTTLVSKHFNKQLKQVAFGHCTFLTTLLIMLRSSKRYHIPHCRISPMLFIELAILIHSVFNSITKKDMHVINMGAFFLYSSNIGLCRLRYL